MMDVFTVGDLKRLLADVDDSLPVCRPTHFLTALPYGRSNFSVPATPRAIVQDGWQYALGDAPEVGFFSIDPPDIGPEPD